MTDLSQERDRHNYGALLVEVQTLKTDLEAAHNRALTWLAWGAGGGFAVGLVVMALIGGI